MYIKLPGGRRNPEGYIVPCDIVQKVYNERMGVCGAYVKLGDETDKHRIQMYVKIEQLLDDDEVESE